MSVALATNALISAEEYLAFIGDDSDRTVNEDQLYFHINAASQAIIDYLDRKVCPVEDVTEVFDGDGTKDYYVRHVVINSEPTLSYWNGSDWTEMTTASYYWTYDGVTGRVYFERGFVFSAGDDNYQIEYNTGYAQVDVPMPIKQACCQLVQRALLKAEGKEGFKSESVGEASSSYDLAVWPPDVLAQLQQYRHISLG